MKNKFFVGLALSGTILLVSMFVPKSVQGYCGPAALIVINLGLYWQLFSDKR